MKKIMAVALSLLMLMTALQIASFAADYVDGRPNHLKLNSGVTAVSYTHLTLPTNSRV